MNTKDSENEELVDMYVKGIPKKVYLRFRATLAGNDVTLRDGITRLMESASAETVLGADPFVISYPEDKRRK